MVERPILFSGPMVRALLGGRKTVTRRIIKPQPTISDRGNLCWKDWCYGQTPDGRPAVASLAKVSPYGQPGDRLWARETWALEDLEGDGQRVVWQADRAAAWRANLDKHFYLASDYTPTRWRPSIHMPRWACRLIREVVSVRAERLHDITEEDAKAEGAEPIGITFRDEARGARIVPSLGGPYRDGFRILWESINGAESWDANPWVWRVELKQVEGVR
ncbi:hypothetical protein [Corallococcus carmarthensis]|uniref:Morphogenetic protein n=1 Tax=Corallococcus carmarthensis TaxID=2316728 RepID=A0A3A8K4J0_9BACT|nr:hypothetical protein [Corallococcus carmarthensis]RKH02970.1 hypothetical protein D7X32_15280 [Corallococcus carmarthensis]